MGSCYILGVKYALRDWLVVLESMELILLILALLFAYFAPLLFNC